MCSKFRSSSPELLCKRGALLRISQNSQENFSAVVSFNKNADPSPAFLLKRKSRAKFFMGILRNF